VSDGTNDCLHTQRSVRALVNSRLLSDVNQLWKKSKFYIFSAH